MIWRQLADFPDYEVSEAGGVRRLTDGSLRYRAGYVLKPKAHCRGYLCYTLKRPNGGNQTVLAHRLVALTFLGPQPSSDHEVAHSDGTRTNNVVGNLRWATKAENQQDRKRHGTWLSGAECGSAVLADHQVEDIRSAYASGGVRYRRGGSITMQALADKHGVSITQISRIVNGRQRTQSSRAS